MKKAVLHDLFIHEIQDLYSAEQQLIEALPMMAEAASSPDLQAAFEKHLTQTEEHATRLEEIAEALDFEVEGEECRGMAGLVEEGQSMIDMEFENEVVADLALIGAAQRVEHYEMAGYGTARSLAEQMGHEEAVTVLQSTLDEEGQTDQDLTALADTLYAEISNDEEADDEE